MMQGEINLDKLLSWDNYYDKNFKVEVKYFDKGDIVFNLSSNDDNDTTDDIDNEDV